MTPSVAAPGDTNPSDATASERVFYDCVHGRVSAVKRPCTLRRPDEDDTVNTRQPMHARTMSRACDNTAMNLAAYIGL